MPDLLLTDVDAGVLQAIAARAASHGVTPEEEHRRILMEVLGESIPYATSTDTEYTFKDHLMALGDVAGDVDFERPRRVSKRPKFEG